MDLVVINMKKLLCILLIVFLCISTILVGIKFFQNLFFAEPNIMQRNSSPDGKYTANVFESNGGATTGWTYHVSVLEKEKKLNKGNGNVYISEIPPNGIEWLESNVLYIDDYKSIKTTRQRQEIKDVTIKYKSLEK